MKQGEIVGFLGPNGAGKSTTMKMLVGYLTPTSGDILIKNEPLQENKIEIQNNLGYLPEGAPAYSEMKVKSFLNFIAEIRGLRGIEKQTSIAEVIEKTNLKSVINENIEFLSKGFKRRVGLAQAIIHDPQILILDEPTDGLDPNQKNEVRKLINNMAKDKIIILSTHILEEVEALCNRTIIISDGEIVVDSTPLELMESEEGFSSLEDVFRAKTITQQEVG